MSRFYSFLIIILTTFSTGSLLAKEKIVNDGLVDPSALKHVEASKLGVENMDRVLYLVRELLRRDSMKDFLRKELSEYLTISKAARKNWGYKSRVTEITEGQLYLLLYSHPEFHDEVEKYLKRVPIRRDARSDKDIKEAEVFRGQFKEFMKDPEVQDVFLKLNRPSKPVPLFYKNGRPGFTDIQFYTNSPRYAVEFDGKKVTVDKDTIIPPDNLLKVLTDFIDGSKEVLMLNIFEVDIPKIVDHVEKALDRGVDVYFGIDKEHVHNPEREAIVHRLQKIQKRQKAALRARGVRIPREPNPTLMKPLGGYLHLHLVDTNNLMHQKLAARDPHLKNKGAVLEMSSNWTYGGMHPGGDLKEEGVGLKGARPNLNQASIVLSDLAAKLACHEMTKTIVLKFKGSSGSNSYYTSNAWRVLGPVVETLGGLLQTQIIQAFTPNGGLRNVSKNLGGNMLKMTKGPLTALKFSASSEELAEDIENRIIKDFKKTGEINFQGVSDYKGAISPWSMFLNLIDLVVVKDEEGLKQYAEDPENKMRKALGEVGIQKLREMVRIAPKSMFEYQKIKMPDGSEKTITILQHSKVIGSGWATTAGSSLNASGNAEKNHEQFLISIHPNPAIGILGMMAYIMDQTTEQDILFVKAMLRNIIFKENHEKKKAREERKRLEERIKEGDFSCQNFFAKAA